jgi:hypothetical protein
MRQRANLAAVVQQAAVVVAETVKRVAKVSKLEQAMMWLRAALNGTADRAYGSGDGPQGFYQPADSQAS